jgi:hypothetical protein
MPHGTKRPLRRIVNPDSIRSVTAKWLYAARGATLNAVPAKKQDTLRARLSKARRRRKLTPKPGHEVSADGKEVRTPTAGEFFGNLDKLGQPDKS